MNEDDEVEKKEKKADICSEFGIAKSIYIKHVC